MEDMYVLIWFIVIGVSHLLYFLNQ